MTLPERTALDLCGHDKLLHEALPTMNREDDTRQDMREWVAAHS